MKVITLFLTAILAFINASAQPPKAAEANISLKKIDSSTVELVINLTPAEGFHIYSFIPTAEKGGPRPFEINTAETPSAQTVGKPTSSVAPTSEVDPSFGMKVNFWDKPVVIKQRFKLNDANTTALKGYIRFQGCNGDLCTPPRKQAFNLTIPAK